MIVMFDSSVLIDLFNPNLKGDLRAKLDDLSASLHKNRARIIIPAPALAEVMVKAGRAKEAYFQLLNRSTVFKIAPFDAKAAMECAYLLEQAFSRSEQKNITRTKFKFDWQIVAIAITNGAEVIFSEDEDLGRCAARMQIRFQRLSALPMPPASPHGGG